MTIGPERALAENNVCAAGQATQIKWPKDCRAYECDRILSCLYVVHEIEHACKQARTISIITDHKLLDLLCGASVG